MFKQRKKRNILPLGAGLGLLLIGAALVAHRWVGLENWVGFIQAHKPLSLSPRSDSNTAILPLVPLAPAQRVSQLTAIAQGSKSPDRARARYLLAADLIEQKQGEKALSWLEGLEWDYPVLAAHVGFKKAQAYQVMGDQAKALDTWQGLLKRHADDPVAAEALYALSTDEVFPKYWDNALKKYPSHPRILELAQQELKKNPNQPQLMLLLAKYRFDQPDITPLLDQLVSKYGNTSGKEATIQPADWEAIALGYWENQKYGQASAAYAKAPRTSRNAYRVARGLDLAEKRSTANRAYKQMVAEFPDAEESATALLRIAQLEPAIEAVPYLDKVVSQFPERAGDALVAEAAILDNLKSVEAAAEARQLLLTKYGSTDAAAEYRWKQAQKNAAAGDFLTAWKLAQPIATENPNSDYARRASFWVGKWARKLGRQEDAKAAFEHVVAQYPQSYYAWRSAVSLGWKVGDFTTVRQMSPQVSQPIDRPVLPLGSDALKELYQLGQGRDAWSLWQAEFHNRIQPTVAEQFTEGLVRLAAGDHLKGISQISTLEDRETPEEQAQYKALLQQSAYWEALYPFPFFDIVTSWSQQRQLNPLLVVSLIRQESRFEPKIRSVAGAVGLMQVMPGTGDWIAQKIGVKQYNPENPNDNVKLGTWYLDHTHDEYSNNSMLAVASYNAGPGNVAKWLSQRPLSDPDEFVENIPFDETRNYVKNVFGNYWNYSRLYNPQVTQMVSKYAPIQSAAIQP